MEIILKQDIKNLGYKNDIVTVKEGYGRNYLIPQGMATEATVANKKIMSETKKQQAFKEDKLRNEATELANKLSKLEIKVGAKVSSTGKIFGSVNNIQIADAIRKAGYDIDRKGITIKDEIKGLGKFNANIRIYKDIKTDVAFEVIED